jgi:hypothetical protein
VRASGQSSSRSPKHGPRCAGQGIVAHPRGLQNPVRPGRSAVRSSIRRWPAARHDLVPAAAAGAAAAAAVLNALGGLRAAAPHTRQRAQGAAGSPRCALSWCASPGSFLRPRRSGASALGAPAAPREERCNTANNLHLSQRQLPSQTSQEEATPSRRPEAPAAPRGERCGKAGLSIKPEPAPAPDQETAQPQKQPEPNQGNRPRRQARAPPWMSAAGRSEAASQLAFKRQGPPPAQCAPGTQAGAGRSRRCSQSAASGCKQQKPALTTGALPRSGAARPLKAPGLASGARTDQLTAPNRCTCSWGDSASNACAGAAGAAGSNQPRGRASGCRTSSAQKQKQTHSSRSLMHPAKTQGGKRHSPAGPGSRSMPCFQPQAQTPWRSELTREAISGDRQASSQRASMRARTHCDCCREAGGGRGAVWGESASEVWVGAESFEAGAVRMRQTGLSV